jgi:hypothetical protein
MVWPVSTRLTDEAGELLSELLDLSALEVKIAKASDYA